MNEMCVHHWVLQAMTRFNVPARCRHCDAERVFTGLDLGTDPLRKHRYGRKSIREKHYAEVDA